MTPPPARFGKDAPKCPVVLRYQCPELLRGKLAHAPGQALKVGHQHGHGLGSETGAFDRVKRREITLKPVDHELEDPLRSLEAFQTVFAEIEEANPLELLVRCKPGGRARQQHLAAVADGADAVGPVHAHADVSLGPEVGLGGVKTHADLGSRSGRPGVRCERALHRDCGEDGILDAPEGDEERIALGIDLPSLVLGECRPQQLSVLAKHVGVPLAQCPDELRRSLHVSEEERDGAARLCTHRALDRRRRGTD